MNRACLALAALTIFTVQLDAQSGRPGTEDTMTEFLPNGDFELGHQIWIEYSHNGHPTIYRAPNLPVTPRSGSWAAWLGGDVDEFAEVEQRIEIPSSSPFLKYWHWIRSNESVCRFDRAAVIVDRAYVVDAYNLCTASNTNGWVLHSVDMGAYAGQTVWVSILASTDDNYETSSLFVDDVYFEYEVLFADGFELGNTSAWSHKTSVVDQVQEEFDFGFWFGAEVVRWQEFVPTLDNLTAVEIYVEVDRGPGSVVVEITTDTDVLLGQSLISGVTSTGWLEVPFGAPLSLTPGDKYRIRVHSDTDLPGPRIEYQWRGSLSSGYCPDCLTDVSGTWPDYDYAFRTIGYP